MYIYIYIFESIYIHVYIYLFYLFSLLKTSKYILGGFSFEARDFLAGLHVLLKLNVLMD